MKKALLLLLPVLLLSCGPGTVHRQLSADSDVFDAGILADTASRLEHTFLLRNGGRDSCRIVRVERSCGCTGTELSSTLLPPGGTASLRVSVNLTGLFDCIDKTVTVQVLDQDRPLVLHLKADKPRPAPSASDYPYSPAGAACFPANVLFAGYVHHGEVKEVSLNVFNNSGTELRLKKVGRLPKHLTYKAFPSRVAPYSLGRITLAFDMRRAEGLYGEFQQDVVIADGAGNRIPLSACAIVIDEAVAGQLPQPRLHAPVTGLNILEAEKGTPMLVKTFEIVNTGNADLIIRDIDHPEEVEAAVTERLVQPGRRTVLSVTIPDGTLLGRAEVKLTTNDPQEPYKTFVVKPFDSR